MFDGSRLFPWKFFVVVTPNQYYRVLYDVRCIVVVYVFMYLCVTTSPIHQRYVSLPRHPGRARAWPTQKLRQY